MPLPHQGIVDLVRELERAIGRERPHLIIEKAATLMTVEGIHRAVGEESVPLGGDVV
ncbi:MAG: hypothetical protein JSV27_04690 [Candidatus Bathyarchaeota archaeon]|nr:MAG: hypothetical protein JSV27_04690 [Candidatus Bathyarchaeota archaeon]